MAKKLQDELHVILRPIKYKNPDSPLYRKTVKPRDGQILPFPHLSDAEILLLRKKRIIAPATTQDKKDVEAGKKSRADAIEQEKQRAVLAMAEMKKAALQKQTRGE